MHQDATNDPETGDEKKPVNLTSNNDTKYGVDILDEMCRSV